MADGHETASASAPPAAQTSAPCEDADASGALAWAAAVPRGPNGRMRAWLDVDATEGRPETMLWPASLVLLRHLETQLPEGYWRGKRVLELGAGMGHLAVGLARLGAHVTATEAGYGGVGTLDAWSRHLLQQRDGGGEPVADDGRRSAGHSAHGGTVATRELWWGDGDGLSRSFAEGFEVVVMSELVYDEDLHDPLLLTLHRALAPGCEAWSVFCDRPFSFNFFAKLADAPEELGVAGYEVEEVEPKQLLGLDTEHEALFMHRITRHRDAGAGAGGATT